MKKSKTFRRIMSSVLVVSILMTGVCSVSIWAKEYKNTKFIYCNICNSEWDPIDMDFNFDFDMITNGDNQTYSKDLAIVSALFATAAYSASDPQRASMACSNAMIEGCTYANNDPIGFGKALGFEDSYFYDLYSNQCFMDGNLEVEIPTYDVDTDDTTAYYFGHKKVGDTEVIIMSIRGTNGTQAEWASNFDVGSDTENYYNMVGYDHPDWTDKSNLKGCDVAKTRVLKAYKSYEESYIDKSANKAILITGHSRGASIANLLGKEFEDNTSYKPFTYTFAGPNATDSKNYADYKTIWNIVNTDDIVPQLPTKGMGFNKYGTTIEVSVKNGQTKDGKSLKKTVEELCNWFNYKSNSCCSKVIDAFNELVPNREKMYDIDYSWAAQTTKYCNTEKEAQAYVQELKDYRLYKYSSVEVVDGTFWGTNVIEHPSPATAAQTIANLAAEGASYATNDTCNIMEMSNPKWTNAMTSFIEVYLGGMEDPHMMCSYYAIVKEAI